ncbi:MAG: preprotein translocase subunit SecG [Bacteroidales bacterium]|jgi:preprotein translocase subunit SecG|nr:preprotein translocase subunit SecG [Bacteroidales bacterium]
MYTLLIVIIVIVAILLGLVVLMQNSKGGGLSSTFSSSSQIMGVRKTADFLEKATWTFSIIIVVLCFVSSFFAQSAETESGQQQGSKAAGAQTMTSMPTAAPAPAATTEQATPQTNNEPQPNAEQ